MELGESKIIFYLKTIKEDELKRFKLFVQANNHIDGKPLQLVLLLLEQYPLFKKINAKDLNKTLFGAKQKDLQQLRNTITQATQTIEAYFIHINATNTALKQKQLLSEALLNRGLYKFYKQEAGKTKSILVESKYHDVAIYESKYKLENLSLSAANKYNEENVSHALLETNKSFDEYYLAQKLKHTTELVNHSLFFEAQTDIGLLKVLINDINIEEYKSNPTIQVYYRLYMLLSTTSEKLFIAAKKEITKHIHSFQHDEQRDLFTLLQNFCILELNKGHTKFLNELFELYVLMLEHKLLINKGLLEEQHFKNIVAIGLRLQKYAWVKKFMQEYYHYLAKEIQLNALHYNMARLLYTTQKFKEALKQLHGVNFSNLSYQLDARVLMLKIYYDTSQLDSLESLMLSFKLYVQRNKDLSKSQREVYFNFVKFIRRIYMIDSGGKGNKEALVNDIKDCNALVDKEWLLQRCA